MNQLKISQKLNLGIIIQLIIGAIIIWTWINLEYKIATVSNDLATLSAKGISSNVFQTLSEAQNNLLNTKSSLTAIFIVMLILNGITIILNLTSGRVITFLLKTLNIDLAKIADGDVSFTPPPGFTERRDEIGTLALSMTNLLGKLKNIVSHILQNADQLAISSQQISSSSQQLSQAVNEQAASIEEISSTIEEISSTIQQNTQNAQTTETISYNAQEGIKDVSDRALKTLEATRTIAGRIKVIGDIAFQTNILALNAAVESARAGEHGRGFAVVAAEVKKLADNSKSAAEEIVKLANDSYSIAEGAGEKMKETLPEINKTSFLVKEIATASIEQGNGIDQLNKSIQQLNEITQQNASSSEELASNSEELANQASSLKDLVTYFKTE